MGSFLSSDAWAARRRGALVAALSTAALWFSGAGAAGAVTGQAPSATSRAGSTTSVGRPRRATCGA